MTKCLLFMFAVVACTSYSTSSTATQDVVGTGPIGLFQLSAGDNFLDSNDIGSFPGPVRLIPDASGSTITGLALGDDANPTAPGGFFLHIINGSSTLPLTIAHRSTAAGADPSDWVTTATGQDEVLLPGQWIELLGDYHYDAVLDTQIFNGWYEPTYRADYLAGAPSSPSRSIGTAWQPSIARATNVIVSLSATCSLTLTGGQAGHIDVKVGPTSSPTTVVGSVPCQNTGAVVVGVNSTVTTGGTVSYIVRPGDWVLVQSTDTAGSPSYTLAVTEETL